MQTKSGGGSKSKNKKKKKPFRGGNYRFDGSAIKKRPAPKKPEVNGDVEGHVLQPAAADPPAASVDAPSPSPATPQPSVLEYLGIHRKGSNEDDSVPKPKKIKDTSEIISQSK